MCGIVVLVPPSTSIVAQARWKPRGSLIKRHNQRQHMPGKATQAKIIKNVGGHKVEIYPDHITIDDVINDWDNYSLIYGLLVIGEVKEALRLLEPLVEEIISKFVA